ncbi:PaaI family thioesterase [Gordonia polyisoprenivorans]|uniref:PaaI family thioesterase n=1 Tax=Gordonia polyisoprenivorans TaxID=84595 RepID=UPI001AD7141F|nr:PaaI family thioesterase [Gordonia polyisoprenivorans]QTI70991.1 PaaI family thioesterase [Gordonia polyisoprenivorans]
MTDGTTTRPRVLDRICTAAVTDQAFIAVHARFGVRAARAEIGYVEVAQAMGNYCLDRKGRLSPGAFLVGVDAALGAAVASRLPDLVSVASLTIHLEFIDLRPTRTVDFVFRGRATHIGEDTGFAGGEIVTDTGRVVAHMSTQCAFVPIDTPPPVIPGCPIDASLLTLSDGGDEALAPLATARAGARLLAGGEDEVQLTATSKPDMCNSRGTVQGGVLAMLAEQAVTAALVRSNPALAEADTMSLDITFIRPVVPERPHVEIVARTEHATRRFASAHAVGRDNSGRVVITASGSRYRG